MYHYSICTIADEVIFQKQCRALETHLPHLVKDELLEDVDGSLMQRYWLDGKMIRVYNRNWNRISRVRTKRKRPLQSDFCPAP